MKKMASSMQLSPHIKNRGFTNNTPHILIFPFPVQGHVNSMLKLAELLSLAGLPVTFLNSDYNHHRLLCFSNVHARFSRFPAFQFKTISDGLNDNHTRSAHHLLDLFNSLNSISKPLFHDLLLSFSSPSSSSSPVSCIIADGIMTFAIDVAQELDIPIFAFRTISACAFWAYFCLPKLIESGELPFKEKEDKEEEDMDKQIKNVPGMEHFLRRRDLPSFCRAKNLNDPVLQLVITETQNTVRASGLILNTFDDLEGPILSQIRSHCPNIYTIGPLHALLNTQLHNDSSHPFPISSSSSNSLWQEERSCMKWLDSQAKKSVLYVSFGSLAVITREKLLEFWFGLVRSGQPFLWVMRKDMVNWEDEEGRVVTVPEELVEGTRERGCVVDWAPQEEVLRHEALGGFLTHSGWNSTLESVYAGVAMICWPYFADQQMNSRFVSEVWRVGVDMKDCCDRDVVEKMVREVMQGGRRREELRRRAGEVEEMAKSSVREGGSSYCNLKKLIEDLRCIGMSKPGKKNE